MDTPRFLTDELILTPELIEALEAGRQPHDALCHTLLTRHQHGDWGNIPENQRIVNEVAVTLGKGTIRSVFTVEGIGDVCIMTNLNTDRHFKPKTYFLLAGRHLTL